MGQMLDSVQVARETVEAFNRADWDGLASILSDESVYDELATQRHVEGRDAILAVNREWKEAFPDAKGEIERVVEAGDTVTLELSWHGHQEGTLHMPTGDLPPTGREIDIKAAQVITVRDGRVATAHHYFDMAGLMQQLGMN